MSTATDGYYIPHEARWPIVGSIGLFILFMGLGNWLNGAAWGEYAFYLGLAIMVVMLFGWFSLVVNESEQGTYNGQVDTSFRMCMSWFIFSEVMFFGMARPMLAAVFRPWVGSACRLSTPCYC